MIPFLILSANLFPKWAPIHHRESAAIRQLAKDESYPPASQVPKILAEIQQGLRKYFAPVTGSNIFIDSENIVHGPYALFTLQGLPPADTNLNLFDLYRFASWFHDEVHNQSRDYILLPRSRPKTSYLDEFFAGLVNMGSVPFSELTSNKGLLLSKLDTNMLVNYYLSQTFYLGGEASGLANDPNGRIFLSPCFKIKIATPNKTITSTVGRAPFDRPQNKRAQRRLSFDTVAPRSNTWNQYSDGKLTTVQKFADAASKQFDEPLFTDIRFRNRPLFVKGKFTVNDINRIFHIYNKFYAYTSGNSLTPSLFNQVLTATLQTPENKIYQGIVEQMARGKEVTITFGELFKKYPGLRTYFDPSIAPGDLVTFEQVGLRIGFFANNFSSPQDIFP